MLTQADPDEVAVLIADARERLHLLLCDLATDDLEPAERACFEIMANEERRYLDGLVAAMIAARAELHGLEFDVPARASDLSPYERRKLRGLFAILLAQVRKALTSSERREVLVAARRLQSEANLRDERDPAVALCLRAVRLAIGLCEDDLAQGRAHHRSSINAPAEYTVAQWTAHVRLEQVRHGLREPGPLAMV